jgi:flagellar biosynthesis protein FlhA
MTTSAAATLPKIFERSDLLLALGMVGTIVVMVIPVPPVVIDLLLTMSISLSLVILLVSLYVEKPLDFNAFPTMLLVITLFRLSINVSTTRAILLHGSEGQDAAGKLIMAFGNFVVGGNYVVGVIVFTVLVIINFIVITKGAGRIAEVTARFTLDAMPGKQMAIDADLNAGFIDEQTARTRRKEIAREADFYGAMDGASKFVRGDAIAGIIIVLVNILGGFVIAVVMKGMTMIDAATTYTILTVGDGLVAQIPALLISTAAGIVMSRAASDADFSHDIARQLFGRTRVLYMAAGILVLFGMVPGMPMMPFLIAAAGTALIARAVKRAQAVTAKAELETVEKPEAESDAVEGLLAMDLIELEVGYGLISLVDATQGGDLLEKVKAIRRQFASKMGIIIPPIHIRDNLHLRPGQYQILIKGVEVGTGDLMTDRLMAMDPGGVETKIDGVPTVEPAFGLPALWIRKRDKEQAQFAGYTVVDLSTIITTHVSEIFRAHAHELLGRQDMQALLDNLAKRFPKAVSDLVPERLPLGTVLKVVQNMLKEEVSVRDLLTIVETLADYAALTQDPDILTEYVRQALARSITKMYMTSGRELPVMTLDANLEKFVADSVHHTNQGSFLSIDPDKAQRLLTKLESAQGDFATRGYRPILLTSPIIRGHLKRFVEKFIPNLVVLSHSELDTSVKIVGLGTIGI